MKRVKTHKKTYTHVFNKVAEGMKRNTYFWTLVYFSDKHNKNRS